MGLYTQNSGYGQAQLGAAPFTTGKVFVISSSEDPNFSNNDGLFGYDPEGVQRRFSSYESALAQCVADRADVILVAPSFDTGITAAELLIAETKGVSIYSAGSSIGSIFSANRLTDTLPATTAEAIFTVTGKIKLVSIIGEVTTVIQTQANDTKLIANPTVGADVDLCAVNDISADAVGTVYSITGTLANAMVATTSGAGVYQAAPIIVTAGTIDLDCAATNTGSIKWTVQYEQIDKGAIVIPTAI